MKRLFFVLICAFNTQALLAASSYSQLTSSLEIIAYQNQGQIETTTRTQLAFGRSDLLTTHAPARVRTTTTDSFTGRQLQQQLANDPATSMSYDALGRQQQVRVGSQVLQTDSYALANGQIKQTKLNNLTGYQTVVTGNALGQTVSQCDNVSSACTTLQYNDLGEVSQQLAVSGILTKTTYNAQGQWLHQVQQVPSTATTAQVVLDNQSREYDNVANSMTQSTLTGDGKKVINRVTQHYNDNQQAVKNQDMDGLSTTTYDNLGQKITSTSERADNTAHYQGGYAYDGLGVLQQVVIGTDKPAKGEQALTVSFGHDLMGQVTSKTLRPTTGDAVQRYHLTFDADKHLVKKQLIDVKDNKTVTQQFSYDNKGNQISATNWDGTPLYQYHYKAVQGQQKLICTDVAKGEHSAAYSIRRDYDDAVTGQLSRVYDSHQPCTVKTVGDAYREIDYRYWPKTGWLREKTYVGSGQHIDYGNNSDDFDKTTGQPKHVVDVFGNTTAYTFDQAHRLSQATMQLNKTNNPDAPKLAIDYRYGDDQDNNLSQLISEQRWQINADGERRMIDTTVYQHDAQGRHVTQILQDDPSNDASITPYSCISMVYGHDDNLISKTVTNPNFKSYTETYQYDGQNRLIQTWHKDASGLMPESNYTTHYTHDTNTNLQTKLVTAQVDKFVHNGESLATKPEL